MKSIIKVELPEYSKIKSGKVRELYKYGEYLLFIATDRISAYDVVFNEGIPSKGIFLNEISKKIKRTKQELIYSHRSLSDEIR